jgi:CBS domain-containing protein
MALMVDYRIRTIPVVNDAAGGKVVVGVVTRRDLMAALRRELQATCEGSSAR